MKPRHVSGYRLHARAILAACQVGLGQDFHTLTSGQVERLLEAADTVKYQRPRHANGSRARYFHDWLQRCAQREDRP